jgi:hypothetical protein
MTYPPPGNPQDPYQPGQPYDPQQSGPPSYGPPPSYDPPAYGNPTSGQPASGQPDPYGQYPPQQPQGYGYPPPGYGGYPQPARGTNIMAILSLVFAFVFAPAGIVLGHIAKKQLRTSGEEGGGLATAGLVLSYIFVGLYVLFCCGIVSLGWFSSTVDTNTVGTGY